MSADPFVPDPLNGQAWNRYAYVINQALSITDPNGYCFHKPVQPGQGSARHRPQEQLIGCPANSKGSARVGNIQFWEKGAPVSNPFAK